MLPSQGFALKCAVILGTSACKPVVTQYVTGPSAMDAPCQHRELRASPQNWSQASQRMDLIIQLDCFVHVSV